MISFLAKIFRVISWALGATPPPPGKNEGLFVLLWLSVTLFGIGFCAAVLYFVLHISH